jgi:transposase
MLPNYFPPYWAVYAHMMRWIRPEVFEEMAKNLRGLRRMIEHGRGAQPTAVVLDRGTVDSTQEAV